MGKLVLKIGVYGILVLLILEGIIRGFHLHKGTPERMIDERGVEKWVPGQTGFTTTGNRRQNFAEYRINEMGFNSYREFHPSDEGYEIALIGDSFIEGFHQDYDNSIGRKIENSLPEVAVYEFGYAGYDLADEIHLIAAYPEVFDKVDQIVIFLQYPDDLFRSSYRVSRERIRLQEGVYGLLAKSKLLVYLQNIGLIGNVLSKINTWNRGIAETPKRENDQVGHRSTLIQNQTLKNLKTLWADSSIEKSKLSFLLDRNKFPDGLLIAIEELGIETIDYGQALSEENEPVTLVYDQHWNDLGRDIIAEVIIQANISNKGLKRIRRELTLSKNGDQYTDK